MLVSCISFLLRLFPDIPAKMHFLINANHCKSGTDQQQSYSPVTDTSFAITDIILLFGVLENLTYDQNCASQLLLEQLSVSPLQIIGDIFNWFIFPLKTMYEKNQVKCWWWFSTFGLQLSVAAHWYLTILQCNYLLLLMLLWWQSQYENKQQVNLF